MFPRSNIAITGGNFWHSEFRVETAFKKLQKASAPSAFHDSSARFDPPQCHPNTRVAILEYLMGWIFGQNDPDALILWLYGPAGAGKSAILQTIAKRCVKRKALLASFFFGRSDPTRNIFKPVIATIAYQIAIAIPEIKPVIENVIEHDPLIFDKSITTQLQRLIVEPLKDLAASGFFDDPSNCARLILIDGLDECNDPQMQGMILRALANALRDQKLRLIFLIASRSEPHLTLTFNSPSLVGLWRSLTLGDSFQSYADICLFLIESFEEIKLAHPYRHLIPEVWPEQSDVLKLIRKSSGQFIYASVVVKYISAPLYRPPHQLEVVMGLRPARCDVPFAELDALYTHILNSCNDTDTILFVLGSIICGFTDKVTEIELLMNLNPGDVEIALAPLTSLINLRSNERHAKCIEISLCHASFPDFLVDFSRSGRFHINEVAVKDNIASKCLRILRDPRELLSKLVDPDERFKELVQPYAIRHHKPPGWNFLVFLQGVLEDALFQLPLSKTVENALKELSLPQFWLHWSERGPCGVSPLDRMNFITIFLNSVSGKEHTADHERLEYSKIREFHLSSFESIFESQLRPYYRDLGLMSMAVVNLLDDKPSVDLGMDQEIAQQILFRLTDESATFDYYTFYFTQCSPIGYALVQDYRYLLTGPKASAEFFPDGRKHSQTALRILEFLCDYPPYPNPYRKPTHRNNIPKTRSTRPRGSIEYSQFLSKIFESLFTDHFDQLPSQNAPQKQQIPKPNSTHTGASHQRSSSPQGIMRNKRLSNINFLRKRREEKHRRGAVLSFRVPHDSTEDPEHVREACILGLTYLLPVLERSSKSPDLVDFIRMRGKDIVFIPNWNLTRRAIHAMHEYLDRPEEDAVMVDLRAKFEAMAIE